MKRLFILTTFLLCISPICLNAQELTLEECQQQAQAHYPLNKRYRNSRWKSVSSKPRRIIR